MLNEVVEWVLTTLEQAEADRSQLERNLIEYERLYEARPKTPMKSFPWKGASNLVVPIIGTAVDAVFARLMNAIFGTKDVWKAVPRSPAWSGLENPMNRWLNWIADNVISLRKKAERWLLGCVKNGTGILKVEWVRRLRNLTYKDSTGGPMKQTVTIHDGPELRIIPLADFVTSADAIHTQDIQNCDLVAERQLFTWKQLKEMQASKIFNDDVDKLKEHKRSTTTDMEGEIARNTGVETSEPNDYEIWEVWCSYDVDNDGIPEELVLNIHKESRTVLRAVFNYYSHQERPYHTIPYNPRENSIFGMGIAQMLAPIQEEVSVIHNQRIDNATLANTTMFKVKGRSAHRLSPLDVYPGAFLRQDEENDIQELKLGQQHQTLLPEELHSNSIGEKRTGVSDYTVGRESSAIGSNATATSTLALIQEGNKRFKLTIENVRAALANIGYQIIMMYKQFAPDGKVVYELFSEEENRMVQEFLKLPDETSRAGVIIDTATVSEASNKDIEKQSYLMLMSLLKQFYEGLMQTFMMALNPQAPPALKMLSEHAATTAAKIWQKMLGTFDMVDAESCTPDVIKMLQLGAGVEMFGGINGQQLGGTQAGSGGAGIEPAMGGPAPSTGGELGARNENPGALAGFEGSGNNA
jgi:hypothetical protein